MLRELTTQVWQKVSFSTFPFFCFSSVLQQLLVIIITTLCQSMYNSKKIKILFANRQTADGYAHAVIGDVGRPYEHWCGGCDDIFVDMWVLFRSVHILFWTLANFKTQWLHYNSGRQDFTNTKHDFSEYLTSTHQLQRATLCFIEFYVHYK